MFEEGASGDGCGYVRELDDAIRQLRRGRDDEVDIEFLLGASWAAAS